MLVGKYVIYCRRFFFLVIGEVIYYIILVFMIVWVFLNKYGFLNYVNIIILFLFLFGFLDVVKVKGFWMSNVNYMSDFIINSNILNKFCNFFLGVWRIEYRLFSVMVSYLLFYFRFDW